MRAFAPYRKTGSGNVTASLLEHLIVGSVVDCQSLVNLGNFDISHHSVSGQIQERHVFIPHRGILIEYVHNCVCRMISVVRSCFPVGFRQLSLRSLIHIPVVLADQILRLHPV